MNGSKETIYVDFIPPPPAAPAPPLALIPPAKIRKRTINGKYYINDINGRIESHSRKGSNMFGMFQQLKGLLHARH